MYADRRIQDWIDSIRPDESDAHCLVIPTAAPPAPERPTKRVCHGLDASYPSSPPLTDDMETPRGRKRPAQAQPDEETPRPVLLTRKSALKSASPRKKTATRSTLENLDKPFSFRGFPNHPLPLERLPEDVQPLYKDLYFASKERAIMPHEIKDKVEDLWLADSSFRAAEGEGDPDRGAEARARALETYTAVSDIVQNAAEASIEQRYETTWNEEVHRPLLKLVFTSTPLGTDAMTKATKPITLRQGVSVRYENVTGAAITTESFRTRNSDSHLAASFDSKSVSSQSVSTDGSTNDNQTDYSGSIFRHSNFKKVDYVLVMDTPAAAKLYQEIMRLARLDCGRDSPYVNQTSYRPIRKSLIAVAIETKTEIPSTDPLCQLGMWTAAWHQRMHALRAYNGDPYARDECLVTLPFIQVIGHNWQIYFAHDRGTSIDLYGPMDIGNTRNVASTYVLLTSLQALRTWIEKVFQDGMRRWFGIEVPAEASASGNS